MPTQIPARLGSCRILKTHDDGDLTLDCRGTQYVVTSEGKVFKAEEACGCRRGTSTAKRAPSAYNNFIGDCMRGKKIKGFANAAPAMKQCAAEWRGRRK